jgi:hypothetical protein
MRDRLVGGWGLQSWTVHPADGGIVHPFGERAQDNLIYAPGGWMSVQIAAADPPGSPVDEQLDFPGTAAYPGYLAYCGTYGVEDGVVLHDVTLSLFPDWVSTRQVRRYELRGDVLVRRTVAAADGRPPSNALRWLREEAMNSGPAAPQY